MTAEKTSRSMLVCLYEDRPQQVAGLKVLLLSLIRYCPTWPVRLRFPGIGSALREWLKQFNHIDVTEEYLPGSGSYNVKPSVLLDGLSTGAESCLWLDTDVLVNGQLDFIAAVCPECVVVTQDPWEYAEGSSHRSASWGMESGRSLPGPLNSAIVRVSGHHVDLLRAWEKLLTGQAYLAEQAKLPHLRNGHMLGDQDALSGLLASQMFASVPLRKLCHSTEILQHHGAGAYGLVQRWSNVVHGMPPLIHAMGSIKPWRAPGHPSLLRDSASYYERTYLELSPYVHYARAYKDALRKV
jgi:hypothetical protein